MARRTTSSARIPSPERDARPARTGTWRPVAKQAVDVAPDPDVTRLLWLAAATPPAQQLDATAAAIQARCWNKSALSGACSPSINASETISAAFARLDIDWN